MLLRTRISFFVILTIGVICASIVFVGLQREGLIKDQYSRESVSDQINLWSKIINEIIQKMQGRELYVLEHSPLIAAIENRDSMAIQQLGGDIFIELSRSGAIDRLDLVYEDGSLAFSSLSSVFQSPIISSSIAKLHIEDDIVARGIGNDAARNTGVIYGFPLYGSQGNPIAMAVFSTDLLTAINEMERVTDSTVVFVNRRGRLISSSDRKLWDSLQKLVDLRELDGLQTANADGRYYSVSVLPQMAKLSGLIGRTVIVKDITELVTQQKVISQSSAVVIVGMVILLLMGLNYYMSRAFSPLTESVGVLNALSKGDLEAQMDETAADNEVGQISNAINRFRADLVLLSRFRRSRERQAARQKRFIIREMSNLSETLDGEERNKALTELEKLRTIVQDASSYLDQQARTLQESESNSQDTVVQEPDSLAMMAIAFQHMSGRIRDQHDRLREAIRTKEALASIQKELDIATRVQYSLIPDDLNISDRFPAAGLMTPAKEVGGDFFDLFRLDDHRIGVAIADVSGKGVPAALFMVMARTLLRSTVFHINSPASVLEYMNHFLERNNAEQLFVTLFYGILDESNGTLTYSTGGHNPPIILDSKGARVMEKTEGTVLAMMDDLIYGETTVTLEKQSRIVMMTDGIPEAFNFEEEAFGDERTLQMVSLLEPGQSPNSDINQLIQTVKEFVGDAPQFDDITCVVLHYNG